MGTISDVLTWFERSRWRRRLLRMDESCLADIGYSRALLEEGVRAWPWRLPSDAMAGLGSFEISDGFRRWYRAGPTAKAAAAGNDNAPSRRRSRWASNKISKAWQPDALPSP